MACKRPLTPVGDSQGCSCSVDWSDSRFGPAHTLLTGTASSGPEGEGTDMSSNREMGRRRASVGGAGARVWSDVQQSLAKSG